MTVFRVTHMQHSHCSALSSSSPKYKNWSKDITRNNTVQSFCESKCVYKISDFLVDLKKNPFSTTQHLYCNLFSPPPLLKLISYKNAYITVMLFWFLFFNGRSFFLNLACILIMYVQRYYFKL